MATSAPADAASFTSSAEIFSSKHTLPQIRAIHNALGVQIEDKASRLRSQVGGSYRELLGTAEAIVQMRRDNDDLQELLGRMGGRCGRGVVDTKAKGLGRFAALTRDIAAGRSAQLQLLDACGLMVGRILKSRAGDGNKRGEKLVLATKVWVLGRLLVTSLAQEQMDDEKVRLRLETARKTIGALRRRLLGCVRRLLDRADGSLERNDVLGALCAYSLITSSGAKDVLRYFLSAREEAISLAFARDEGKPWPTTTDVVDSLRLYTRTVLDVQDLVPRTLSGALADLKSQALLDDPSLKKLEGLGLDVMTAWCSDEMKYFTPFVRHDDLNMELTQERLAEWMDKGSEVILEGLGQTLSHMTELGAITDLRTRTLQLWIREGGKAKGLDPLEMRDELRDAINARLLAVLDDKVAQLRLVGSEVGEMLDGWLAGVTGRLRGLWDDVDHMEDAFADGAAPFIEEVWFRLQGRSDALTRVLQIFEEWARTVDSLGDEIGQLKKRRWDKDDNGDDLDAEIEDEETLEARQQALGRDDPRKLEERLEQAMGRALSELEQQLGQMWREKTAEARGPKAMYMLRIIRDLRAKFPAAAKATTAAKEFGISMLAGLHESLAAHAADPAIDDFAGENGLRGAKADAPRSRRLWEGEPPLPSQPSPAVFELQQQLMLAMMDAGNDLWSRAAIAALKRRVCEGLGVKWGKALDELGEDEGGEEQGEGKQDKGGDEGVNAGEEIGEEGRGFVESGKDGDGDGKDGDKDDEDGSTKSDDDSKTSKDEEDHQGDKTKEIGDKQDDDGDTKKWTENEQSDENTQGNEDGSNKDDDDRTNKEPPHITDPKPTPVRDVIIQWYLDVVFLLCSVGNISDKASEELTALEKQLLARTGLDAEGPERQRLSKAARDYWQRTNLLFGLLG